MPIHRAQSGRSPNPSHPNPPGSNISGPTSSGHKDSGSKSISSETIGSKSSGSKSIGSKFIGAEGIPGHLPRAPRGALEIYCFGSFCRQGGMFTSRLPTELQAFSIWFPASWIPNYKHFQLRAIQPIRCSTKNTSHRKFPITSKITDAPQTPFMLTGQH